MQIKVMECAPWPFYFACSKGGSFLRRLARYIRGTICWYIVGIASIVLSIALDMFNPYIVKVIVDDIIAGGKTELLKGALLALAGITVSRTVLGYLKQYIFDCTSSKIVLRLRKDLFDHIQSLSFSFFDRTNTGELMSRIKDDTENVMAGTGYGISLFIEQVIYFVVASVMLFTLNWKLALVSMLVMPLIAWIAVKLEKRIDEAYGRLSDQRAVLTTTAQENIAGVRLVKAFNREKYEINKFYEQNKENYRLNLEQSKVWADFFPKIEFLSNIVVVLVIGVGGYFVIGDEISVGTLVAFSNYVNMLIWPMRSIGWLTNVLAQCKASLDKIDKIFDEKPEIHNPDNPKVPEKFQGHVEFRNVGLKFGEFSVLNNINIDARPGSTIAIMGITGSGKSSIINLIGRFYDCTSGSVLVDGIDVREMDLKFLRGQISVVMQDTFLFSDTIEDNIKFGSHTLTEDELLRASEDAKVSEFVEHLKEGYKTVVGERGIGLSGGQKQRISIARALSKGRKILILDDATSALDMETEYEIQKALERRKDVTKFIIAHRISAVKNADEILIIENGEIIERGTHDQLLKLKGKYYRTYCEQYGNAEAELEKEVV